MSLPPGLPRMWGSGPGPRSPRQPRRHGRYRALASIGCGSEPGLPYPRPSGASVGGCLMRGCVELRSMGGWRGGVGLGSVGGWRSGEVRWMGAAERAEGCYPRFGAGRGAGQPRQRMDGTRPAETGAEAHASPLGRAPEGAVQGALSAPAQAIY